MDFARLRSRGYSLQEEILWRLKRVGARFGETPIVFVERQRGQSKIDLNEAVNALRIIFSLGMQSLFGRRREWPAPLGTQALTPDAQIRKVPQRV